MSQPPAKCDDLQGIKAEIMALVARAQQAQVERDAEWERQGRVPLYMAPKTQPRTSESAPQPVEPTPIPQTFDLPDDSAYADATWLRFTLGGCPPISRMNWVAIARERYTRGEWRRAVAALIAVAPGLVEDPPKYLRGMLKARRDERSSDPRCRPGYYPFTTWGTAALKFCGLPH